MDLVLVRILFVALLTVVCYFLHPFGLPGWMGAIAGALASGAVIIFELRVRALTLRRLIGGVAGSVLGIFGAAGILFSRRWYGPFILLCCVTAVVLALKVHFFIDKSIYLRLLLLFATGSVLRVYADRIPLSNWIFGALCLVTLLWYHHPGFEYLFTVWLIYAVFWAAYLPDLHGVNRMGDYSYGLYIYAFPIERTLRQYIPAIQPLELFTCASFPRPTANVRLSISPATSAMDLGVFSSPSVNRMIAFWS